MYGGGEAVHGSPPGRRAIYKKCPDVLPNIRHPSAGDPLFRKFVGPIIDAHFICKMIIGAEDRPVKGRERRRPFGLKRGTGSPP